MTRNLIAVIPSYYELSIEQIPPLEVLASSCAVVYVDVVRCSLTHGFLLLSVVSLLRMFLSNFGFGTLIISLPLVAPSEPFLVAFPCTCQLNRILTNYCRRMKLEVRTSFCSWLLSNFHCKLLFFFILFSVVFLFSPPISDWSVSVSTAWADCLCLFHSCMPKAAGLTPLPFLSHLTKGCCISTQANVSDIPFNSCGLFFLTSYLYFSLSAYFILSYILNKIQLSWVFFQLWCPLPCHWHLIIFTYYNKSQCHLS